MDIILRNHQYIFSSFRIYLNWIALKKSIKMLYDDGFSKLLNAYTLNKKEKPSRLTLKILVAGATQRLHPPRLKHTGDCLPSRLSSEPDDKQSDQYGSKLGGATTGESIHLLFQTQL